MKRKTVLFLCTGNYYRSRFAELLFNHFAARHGLGWSAISRGMALELAINNLGPISPAVSTALAARDVALEPGVRAPLALKLSDVEKAHHIVAVDRSEHLPMLQRKFPGYIARVEFWDVQDIGFTAFEAALEQLELNVLALIERLRTNKNLGNERLS
jgi:protein-tyrosine phosphatase